MRHEAWGERQCSISSGIGRFVIYIQRRDVAEQRYRGRAQDLNEFMQTKDLQAARSSDGRITALARCDTE
jgi:hypothetical protein